MSLLKLRMKLPFCLLALLQSFVFCAQTTIYVNQNVQGGLQNGTSWADAFPDLQQALAAANSNDEIWVASGIYYPTTTLARDISFELKNGVRLLGGFIGTEVSESQRDPILNKTRLSGNIGSITSVSDNSYHVLRGRGLDEHTQLDGFTISDGYSAGAGTNPSDPYGAGLYLVGSSVLANSRPLISNCTFENNYAGGAGGAVFAGFQDLDDPSMSEYLVNPVLRNCTFYQNKAQVSGGAIYKKGTTGLQDSFLVENCIFDQNYVFVSDGGGISFTNSNNSKIVLKRNLFQSNVSQGGQGGGFCIPITNNGGYTIDFVLDSCVFYKNSAPEGGGFSFDGRSFDFPDIVFNLKVLDCKFEGNEARNEEGSAFLISAAQNDILNVKLTDSRFIRNRVNSYFTTAIYCYDESQANILVDNCEFIGNINRNDSTLFCAGFDASGHKINALLNNCLFANNGAAIFAGGDEQSQVLTQITNCTFFRNGKQPFGKRWYPSFNQTGALYFNKMNFFNCVIWEPGNSSDLFYNNYPSIINASWFFIDYCTLHPLVPATIPNHTKVLGDSIFIGADPGFLDTSSFDFRLRPCSPAMNRGWNQHALDAGILTDLDHNPRIRFQTVDIGAYEVQDSCIKVGSHSPDTQAITATLSPNPLAPGAPLDIQVSDLDAPNVHWTIRDAFGRTIHSGTTPLSEKTHFPLEAPSSSGIYFVELRSGPHFVCLKFVVQH